MTEAKEVLQDQFSKLAAEKESMQGRLAGVTAEKEDLELAKALSLSTMQPTNGYTSERSAKVRSRGVASARAQRVLYAPALPVVTHASAALRLSWLPPSSRRPGMIPTK